MKVKDWTLIDETSDSRLEPGGYVIRITGVTDEPQKEYLRIIYDIAEGDFKGKYNDAWGRSNPWAHSFIRSYKDSAEGMFKAFLNRLEESNKHINGFTVAEWNKTSDEQKFVGLELGIVLQKRLYTNDKGEDKETLEVRKIVASQDIRQGDYKLPEPRDERENTVPERAQDTMYGSESSVYSGSVPF